MLYLLLLQFYLINISKLAVLLFLLQLIPYWSSTTSTHNFIIFAGIGSLIVGSIGLGSQFKIKRFLSYSSISHLGFMLLALASLQIDSFLYYAFIYFINSITIFTILLALGQIHGREITFIHQLSGLFKMNIPLALILVLSLFSFAGIPPISGFFGKLIVLESYLSQGWITISIIAILTSIISAANYLYFVKVTLFDHATSIANRSINITPSISYLLSGLFSFSIFFILKPASLLILSTNLLAITDNLALLISSTNIPAIEDNLTLLAATGVFTLPNTSKNYNCANIITVVKEFVDPFKGIYTAIYATGAAIGMAAYCMNTNLQVFDTDITRHLDGTNPFTFPATENEYLNDTTTKSPTDTTFPPFSSGVLFLMPGSL